MPRPCSLDGTVVPAYTYRRYLEDFYHYFVEGKAEVLCVGFADLLGDFDGWERAELMGQV